VPERTAVNHYQRAFLAWSVLTDVAAQHRTITYKALADAIGIHHRAVQFMLGIIQDYCLESKKSPLTILVVNQDTERPGGGFIAWDVDNLDEGYLRVYEEPWDAFPNPFAFASSGATPDELAERLVQAPDESEAIYRRIRDRGIAQDVFRRALLKAYRSRCAFCGLSLRVALQAAHIIPWSKASPDQRIAPSNGLLLCATHHSLFDAHWLTVTPDRKIQCRAPSTGAEMHSDSDRQISIALHGRIISVPDDPRVQPSPAALERRRAALDAGQ
jgi:putative restriction endonuclease